MNITANNYSYVKEELLTIWIDKEQKNASRIFTNFTKIDRLLMVEVRPLFALAVSMRQLSPSRLYK